MNGEDRKHLRYTLVLQGGTLARLGEALIVQAVLEGEGDTLELLKVPEAMRARVLLARSLESRLREGTSVELCNAYLSALGDAMIDANSVLGPPSPKALVANGERCMARHPERAARWRLDLVKWLGTAGAPEEALARLEALEAEGLLWQADRAEQVELLTLGRRLALTLGRPEEAARWEAARVKPPTQDAAGSPRAGPGSP